MAQILAALLITGTVFILATATGISANPILNVSDLPFLSPSYSPLLRPNFGTDRPVNVNISMYVTHIEIKHNRMEAIIYLRLSWIDDRLKFQSKVPTLTLQAESIQGKLWTPDVFYPNILEPTRIINRGFIRITPDSGNVLSSQLIGMSLSCPGASLTFALLAVNNTFECSIEAESYAFAKIDIDLAVPDDKKAINVDDQAVNQELYRLIDFNTIEKTIKLSTGNYSRIQFKFRFETNVKMSAYQYMNLMMQNKARM